MIDAILHIEHRRWSMCRQMKAGLIARQAAARNASLRPAIVALQARHYAAASDNLR
jgi:hypothetical protein